MGLIKGGFQRLLQTALYFIIFLCSAIILGFFSYFLSVLADRSQHIPTWEKAVEGISGAACVYLMFAIVLTCCLGGITGFAVIAIVLDILFAAGMIAIAVMTRHGADSCKGTVNTPLGTGPADQDRGFGNFGTDGNENLTYSVHLGLACKYNKVCFAVSIIAALLFLITAALQVLLIRHHKKEKRYGPSPSNNYTSGTGSRFGFGKKKNKTTTTSNDGMVHDVKDNTYNRSSYETGYNSNSTGYNNTTTVGPGYETYGNTTTAPTHGTHGHSGYYTAPTGTATSNPYGYGHTNTGTNY